MASGSNRWFIAGMGTVLQLSRLDLRPEFFPKPLVEGYA